MNRVLTFLGLVPWLLAPAWAADFYVSPNGQDSNDGSAAAPFATITHARDQVRTLTAKMTGPITVWLHDGTYAQSVPLTFDARDSGLNFCDVVYQAVPGEHPVISGGRAITGWTLHDAAKNIWSAPAPGLATRQLYVNGVKAVRAAREADLIAGATLTPTGYTVPGVSPLAAWQHPDAIEFVYNSMRGGVPGGAQWLELRAGVKSIQVKDGQTFIVMKQPAFTSITTKTPSLMRANLPSRVENAYELLDQPGEWYLDQIAGVLYYLPLPGEDMATTRVIAPVLETLVSGAGTIASPLHNLQFKGITFAEATWLRPGGNQGFPEQQANRFTDGTYTPGNVLFQHATDLRFERCNFTRLGGAGLELSHGVQDSTVVGCRFDHISGCGILVGTTTDPARRDPRLRDDHDTVRDCSFEQVVDEYAGGTAIFAGYVSHLLVAHNEIAHVPYTGISVGWGWGASSYAGHNLILDNYVHHFMEVLGDGGGWYALSPQPGSEVAGNWFQHQTRDVEGGTIYPDEVSQGWDIHHNVVDDVKEKWLHVGKKSSHLSIHDNWTTSADRSFSAEPDYAEHVNFTETDFHVVPVNNQVVKGPWPPEAQAVMDGAGLEPAWKDLKK